MNTNNISCNWINCLTYIWKHLLLESLILDLQSHGQDYMIKNLTPNSPLKTNFSFHSETWKLLWFQKYNSSFFQRWKWQERCYKKFIDRDFSWAFTFFNCYFTDFWSLLSPHFLHPYPFISPPHFSKLLLPLLHTYVFNHSNSLTISALTHNLCTSF